jgi:hypothetical protein
MEDELWNALYPLILEEHSRRPRRKRVRFNDAIILLVAVWAILHDRPISWACRTQNWPGGASPWAALPSPATMSRRLRTLSVQLLLEQVFYRLLHATHLLEGLCLCRRIDSKPLPVGGFTKDRDARRRGYATGGLARGYKLFAGWLCAGGNIGVVPVPEALMLGPMCESDPAGTRELIDRVLAAHPGGPSGGYLLADVTNDSNPLHAYATARGFQLVAPRKQPGTGLGHGGDHEPGRLHAIELLEGPDPSGLSFGRSLYALREPIERDFGNAGSFGGGLQPLPNFVRRPRRVALWVIVKFLINGIRICRKYGVTA